MASADIVIAIVILLSAVIGLVRGLLREVVSLAGWLGALLLALYFADSAGEVIAAQLDEGARPVVGFFTVFVIVLLLGGIVQWLVGKLVKGTGLSGTDRFLGFLFGSARGVLVCIVALIMLRPFAGDAEWWARSRMTPELLAFEQDVLELMGKAREVMAEVTDQV